MEVKRLEKASVHFQSPSTDQSKAINSIPSTHRRSSTKQAARLQMQARHCMALLQRMIWKSVCWGGQEVVVET